MIMWIARDKDGLLYLHIDKPMRVRSFFINESNRSIWINKDLFPEVTFENSPVEVELKLCSEIVGVAEPPSKTFPRVNEFETGASYRR